MNVASLFTAAGKAVWAVEYALFPDGLDGRDLRELAQGPAFVAFVDVHTYLGTPLKMCGSHEDIATIESAIAKLSGVHALLDNSPTLRE